MATEAQFNSIESLFDADLNDIADLAAFEVPPPGVYICNVSAEVKEINNTPAVTANFTVLETVELKDRDAKQTAAGTKFSVAFMLGKGISEGKLKQFLAPFAEHFGTSNVGQLVKDKLAEEVTVSIVLKNRKDKDDPERVYPDVREITVV